MKYIIIGTAGHVDHGKTAIIKILTGIDTDRLKEEKKRGISIDLGFASLKIGDALTAGIVDVPGHERFLKNMLAGTGAIDLALLIIAVDESVMPQTKEHLAMLDLLGQKRGLIVINKIDKVDSPWLEMVEDEVRGVVKETFLKDAPICRVSALTGEGIENLKAAILKAAETIPQRDENAPFRLWIDRVFSAKGHGTVVTGSILSGNVKPGDNLVIYPKGSLARVRGIEEHSQKIGLLKAGQRAAINISGENSEVTRGMFLSAEGRGETGNIWDVRVKWCTEPKNQARVRLHLGTSEVLGRVYKYKDTSFEYMRLILEEDITAALGDVGILRLYSPQVLLGSVTFLSPGRRSRRFNQNLVLISQSIDKADLGAIITGRLSGQRRVKTLPEIALTAGYWPDSNVLEAVARLVEEGALIRLESGYIMSDEVQLILKAAEDITANFHSKQPEKSGLGKEILRQQLKLDEKTFESLLAYWHKNAEANNLALTGSGSEVALKSHAQNHSSRSQLLAEESKSFLQEAGFANIDVSLVESKMGLSAKEAKAAHEMMVKSGLLIKIGTAYFYSKAIEDVLGKMRVHFAENPTLSVSEFKDIAGLSRKFAVPVLEYFDSQKYTVRSGDLRKLGGKVLKQEKV